MPKEIRLEIKPRNNLVLTRMEELKIDSVAELCRRAKLTKSATQRVSYIIGLKSSPLRSLKGHLKEWKEPILAICEVLECTPEELFPESIRGVRISRGIKVFTEVSFDDMKLLGGHMPKQLVVDTDPEKGMMFKEFEDALEKAFKTLTPREEQILKLRFGFEGGKEHTLEELGEMFGVSNQRIRQIEDKGLRKMRHPSRSRRILAGGGDLIIGRRR